MIIKKMNQIEAEDIANNWKYEGVYSFYDMTEDVEDYEEIISPTLRGDRYFSVIEDEKLIGFFCVEQDNNDIEIGLGLKPELTDKGSGLGFVKTILEFVSCNYKFESVILSIADFNKRAIIVYERAGFVATKKIKVNTNGGVYDFVVMELKKGDMNDDCRIFTE
jgi:ribosomal-protein-alanine N-acetyltransferase